MHRPRLILHNGNTQVKSWLAQRWNCEVMPTITDAWHVGDIVLDTLPQRIQYLHDHPNIISDLLPCNQLEMDQLILLRSHLQFVKVITDRSQDLQYLDPGWSPDTYDFQQWLGSCFYCLGLTDELIWWCDLDVAADIRGNPVVFTPGRSGTHLLLDIIDLPQRIWIHHDNTHDINGSDFISLTSAPRIYAILRRSLLAQTLSFKVAANTGRFMLSTKQNIKLNQAEIDQWSPMRFDETDCIQTLTILTNYVNILLGLRYLYNKQIMFCLYEDLQHHYDRVNSVKNPYDYPSMFENYNEAVQVCQSYQPFYDQLIQKLICIFGIGLFNG